MNLEIANRLVKLRKENHLSQEQLAEKIGISRQAVSKWERAEASPDTDNLILLARLYHISLDELLKTEEPVEAAEQPEIKDADVSEQSGNGFWRSLPYPLVISILYLILGFVWNLWHPGWILFLTIPVYYSMLSWLENRERRIRK